MTVERLAALATGLVAEHGRVLIAVDGPDAAGKTTFAAALAERLPCTRASLDDFLHPAQVRRQRGELSPEGYYRDSFDYATFLDRVVRPFAEGVLVVDGVFLLRPELRHVWSVSVYLHVPPEVTLQRALVRDSDLMGGQAEVERRYGARYLPGQALYRAEAQPEQVADVLIDNTDPTAPVVLRWSLG